MIFQPLYIDNQRFIDVGGVYVCFWLLYGRYYCRSTFSSIETFKEVYQQLKEKLLKLQAPAGTSEDPPTPQGPPSDPLGIESDVEMQKMVNDMIEWEKYVLFPSDTLHCTGEPRAVL